MSIFRPRLDETAGFSGLRTLVQGGQAISFPWGLKKDLSFFAALNPFSYRLIYQTEQQMTLKAEIQERLFEFLNQQNTTCVIGHSLGCRLIYQTLKQFGVPTTLRRIIWIQAGMDVDVSLPDFFPELIHFWCPWDPTLLLSTCFLHGHLRAGLVPIKGAKNTFAPLWRFPNLHTSSQKSSDLLKWVV